MTFADFTHGRYDLAERTADQLRSLLIRLYGGTTVDALPAPAGIFCRDITRELTHGKVFVLTVDGIIVRENDTEFTSSPFVLPKGTGQIEVELGQITLGGVVHWKSHAVQ